MAKQFDEWKKRVDVAIIAICGLGADDLPDYDYYNAFEAGKDPAAVAKAAIRAAGPEGAKVVRDLTSKTRTPPKHPKFSEWQEAVRTTLNARYSLSLAVQGHDRLAEIREWFEKGVTPTEAAEHLNAVDLLRTRDPVDATGSEFEQQ